MKECHSGRVLTYRCRQCGRWKIPPLFHGEASSVGICKDCHGHERISAAVERRPRSVTEAQFTRIPSKEERPRSYSLGKQSPPAQTPSFHGKLANASLKHILGSD